MLVPGWVRNLWGIAAVGIVIFGVVFTATHLNLSRFDNELRFRGQAHDDLTEVLSDPQVKAGLKCGPLTGPNHKIVPDSRWIAGLGDGRVLAREWVGRIEQQEADATAGKRKRDGTKIQHPDPDDLAKAKLSHEGGVAIVVTSRFAIFKHAWSDASDDPRINIPPDGFKRVKTSRFYAAYVRCP